MFNGYYRLCIQPGSGVFLDYDDLFLESTLIRYGPTIFCQLHQNTTEKYLFVGRPKVLSDHKPPIKILIVELIFIMLIDWTSKIPSETKTMQSFDKDKGKNNGYTQHNNQIILLVKSRFNGIVWSIEQITLIHCNDQWFHFDYSETSETSMLCRWIHCIKRSMISERIMRIVKSQN